MFFAAATLTRLKFSELPEVHMTNKELNVGHLLGSTKVSCFLSQSPTVDRDLEWKFEPSAPSA